MQITWLARVSGCSPAGSEGAPWDLAHHWTGFGFGTPQGIYVLYAVKMALFVLGAMLFIASTPGIGGQELIIWTLLLPFVDMIFAAKLIMIACGGGRPPPS